MLTYSSVNYSKLSAFETTTEEVTDRSTTFGTSTTDSSSTDAGLQFARVPVISDAKCKQYYIGKKILLEPEYV